jgi:predicted nucleotidyltransferase component of viral defense system
MLQKQAVTKKLLELVETLQQIPLLEEFNLVGGTALALQMGHRFSEDIDLFTRHDFNRELILEALKEKYGKSFKLVSVSQNTVNCTISNIKIDLLKHGYPVIAPVITEDNLKMFGLSDIAAMKLNAIAGNGTRVKDFIDVYFLLEHFQLKQLFSFYKKKYAEHDIYHVKKSLTYFDDIPSNSWENVRFLPGKGLDFDTMRKKLLNSVREYENLQRDIGFER